MAATYKVTKIEAGRATVVFTYDDLPDDLPFLKAGTYTKSIGGLPVDDPVALDAAVEHMAQAYWQGKQIELAAAKTVAVPVALKSAKPFDPTYVKPPPEPEPEPQPPPEA